MKKKEPKKPRAKKAEKPVPFMVRLYKKQRRIVKLIARGYKISDAEVIRRAIDIASKGL